MDNDKSYNKGFNDCLKLTIEAFECLETHNFRVWLDGMNKWVNIQKRILTNRMKWSELIYFILMKEMEWNKPV